MNEIYETADKKYNIDLKDFVRLLELTEDISNKILEMKSLHNRKKNNSLFMIVVAYVFLTIPSISVWLLKINSFHTQGEYLFVLFGGALLIGLLIFFFAFKAWKEARILKHEISKEELILAKLINNLNNYLNYLYPVLSSIEATIFEIRMERLHFKVVG